MPNLLDVPQITGDCDVISSPPLHIYHVSNRDSSSSIDTRKAALTDTNAPRLTNRPLIHPINDNFLDGLDSVGESGRYLGPDGGTVGRVAGNMLTLILGRYLAAAAHNSK